MRKLFSGKKRKFFILLLIVVVFFVGKYLLVDSKKSILDSAIVEKSDIKEELVLSGKIDAEDHITLNFRAAGKVDWVGVEKDQWVTKGQAIASLQKDLLEAALRQAWQDFTAAKAASDKYYDGRDGRNEESYAEKIERTALDAAQNKAYDNTRIAQSNLDNATLYSPIDGFVVGVDPEVAGVNVAGLNAGYEIVNPATIYLRVTADQTEVGSLKEEKTGTITFDSYSDEQIEGTIKGISFSPSKDEAGTAYDVKVILNNVDNKDYKYRLGMTADISFVLKEDKNVLILPLNYVGSDDKGKYVLLGKEKKKTYVTTGIESEQSVEITKGLSEGQIVYGL
jgi:RND family efflux transporter MFP subunit